MDYKIYVGNNVELQKLVKNHSNTLNLTQHIEHHNFVYVTNKAGSVPEHCFKEIHVATFLQIQPKNTSWKIGCTTFSWEGDNFVSDDGKYLITKKLINEIWEARPCTSEPTP